MEGIVHESALFMKGIVHEGIVPGRHCSGIKNINKLYVRTYLFPITTFANTFDFTINIC
jgi:hypothetical protein